MVYENGDPDYGIWRWVLCLVYSCHLVDHLALHSAGLAVGLIKDAPSCEVLLRRIEKEAEDAIGNLSSMVSSKQKAKL